VERQDHMCSISRLTIDANNIRVNAHTSGTCHSEVVDHSLNLLVRVIVSQSAWHCHMCTLVVVEHWLSMFECTETRPTDVTGS